MQNQTIQLEDGKYVVQVQAVKKDTEEASAMGPYLSNNSIVTYESGEIYLTLMLVEEKIITGLQIKNKEEQYEERINFHRDEEANARYEIFKLDHFQSVHEAKVQYEIEHEGEWIKGDEELRLFFEPDSIQNVEDIQF